MDQARLKEELKEAALRLVVGAEDQEEIIPGCEQTGVTCSRTYRLLKFRSRHRI